MEPEAVRQGVEAVEDGRHNTLDTRAFIAARPPRGKGRGGRGVRLVRYAHGWNITLSIADDEHAPARGPGRASAELTLDGARELLHRLEAVVAEAEQDAERIRAAGRIRREAGR